MRKITHLLEEMGWGRVFYKRARLFAAGWHTNTYNEGGDVLFRRKELG
jgi:hypothetical protein